MDTYESANVNSLHPSAIRSKTSINEAQEDEEMDGGSVPKNGVRISGIAEDKFKF